MTPTNIERRIARVARQSAKLVLELRREGKVEAARELEAIATAACEQMRRGLIHKFRTGQIQPGESV